GSSCASTSCSGRSGHGAESELRSQQPPLLGMKPQLLESRRRIQVGRSLALQELLRIDDEAHRIVAALARKGIRCVIEEADPSALCSEFNSGLARKMQRLEAWSQEEEELPRCSAGPLPLSEWGSGSGSGPLPSHSESWPLRAPET
ncbi:unnamed protein product, partial [Polarella glacialis]